MLIPTTSGGVLVHISCNKARTKTTATASIDHRHRHLTVSSMAYSMYHLSTECCEHWLSSVCKQINADKNITLLVEVKRISYMNEVVRGLHFKARHTVIVYP